MEFSNIISWFTYHFNNHVMSNLNCIPFLFFSQFGDDPYRLRNPGTDRNALHKYNVLET